MKNIKVFINESIKNDDVYDAVSDFVDDVIHDMNFWNDSDIEKYISGLHDDLYEIGDRSKDVRELINYVKDNSDADPDDDDFVDRIGDALNKKYYDQ